MAVDDSVNAKFISKSFFSDVVRHDIWPNLPCGAIAKDIFARELFAVFFSAFLRRAPRRFRE
jgi:hypothetical protein